MVASRLSVLSGGPATAGKVAPSKSVVERRRDKAFLAMNASLRERGESIASLR
jgi:hypothetical protein